MPESVHIPGANAITEEFCEAAKDIFGDSEKFHEMGGLPQMAEALAKPMVLVMSLWDDVSCSPCVTWLPKDRVLTILL